VNYRESLFGRGCGASDARMQSELLDVQHQLAVADLAQRRASARLRPVVPAPALRPTSPKPKAKPTRPSRADVRRAREKAYVEMLTRDDPDEPADEEGGDDVPKKDPQPTPPTEKTYGTGPFTMTIQAPEYEAERAHVHYMVAPKTGRELARDLIRDAVRMPSGLAAVLSDAQLVAVAQARMVRS
jgi:hypothetical protein